MNQLLLWRLLHDDTIDADAVVPLVDELASESFRTRWPYFAVLEPCTRHGSARLRAAAYRALAGASGTQAWRVLIEGIEDADEIARGAALEALRVSAHADPARWIHALAHRDAGVRRAAFRRLPAGFPRRLLAHFGGDEENRAAILAHFTPVLHEPASLRVLLDAVHAGWIDGATAARATTHFPWDRSAAAYLRALPGRPPERLDVLRRAPSDPAAVEEWTRELLGGDASSDRFDQVVELCWDDIARAGDDSRDGLLGGLAGAARRREVDEARHLRVAFSLVRMSLARETWPPLALALAAAAAPELLACAAIPLEARTAAARTLERVTPGVLGAPGRTGISRPWPAPASLLRSDVCRTAASGIDLRAVAGVLRLFKLPLTHLFAAGTASELARVCLDDPPGGASIFALPIEQTSDVRVLHDVLREIPRDERAPVYDAIADAAIARPARFVVLLRVTSDELASAVLRALLTRAAAQPIDASTARLLADALAPRFHRRQAGWFLRAFLLMEHAESNAIGMEIFARLASRGGGEWFRRLGETLEPAVLRALVRVAEHSPAFDDEAEMGLALSLADSRDEALALWGQARLAGIRPARGANPKGADTKDADTKGADTGGADPGGAKPKGAEPKDANPMGASDVREIGAAEAEWVAMCPADEFEKLMGAYARRPVRGLTRGLAEREASARPTARIAALVSTDPLPDVALQLERFAYTGFVADPRIARELQALPYTSVLAAVFACDTEQGPDTFLPFVAEQKGGAAALLRLALELPSGPVCAAVWSTVRFALVTGGPANDRWRYVSRAIDRLAGLLASLAELLADVVAWSTPERPSWLATEPPPFDRETIARIEEDAAHLLASAARSPHASHIVDRVRPRLRALAPALPPLVASILRDVLAPSPVREPSSAGVSSGEAPHETLDLTKEDDVLPLLLQRHVVIAAPRTIVETALRLESASAIGDTVEAALVAGPRIVDAHASGSPKEPAGTLWIVSLLDQKGLAAELRNELCALVATESVNEPLQAEALRRLRGSRSRNAKLRALGAAHAWGIQVGYRLTGRRFAIELLGGTALGYTHIGGGTISVNPLPLLRGEREGDRVVRGLIAHEIGHHVYHGGTEGQRVWKEAEDIGLIRLLNLVADEHLERNLRTRDAVFGDYFHTLAAYAFQHTHREIEVEQLLASLGPWAAEVLRAATLRPARRPGCVRVSVADLFRRLEASQSSFSRFVRALRMGLGDRHGDAKVREGLALFGRDFRRLDMRGLMERTLRLREIFGDEVRLLDVLDQGELTTGAGEEIRRLSEGITDDKVKEASDRVLRLPGPPSRGGRRGGRGGPAAINVSADESFNEIDNVEVLPFDRAAHRGYATRVARASARMRQYFAHLGLGVERRRQRLAGRSVDRTGLERAVVRRDPRILVARERTLRRDLFLGIVVDCSGSMGGASLEKAKLFAAMLAEAARGLDGLDVRVFGFTDSVIYDAGTAERCAVHALRADGGNNDAAALWHAAREAMRSRRGSRLLVMISDGLPTQCSVAALRGLVTRLTLRRRITCAQVAVRRLEEQCFAHYIELLDDDVDAAVRRFGRIVERLVTRSLGR